MKTMLMAVLLLASLTSVVAKNEIIPKTKEVNMSVYEKNKEVVKKIYEEALNKRRMELLEEMISDDFVGPRGIKGAAGFKVRVSELIDAFPDARWKVEELIAESDKVVVKWELTGTHTGKFMHIPPTGETITNDGIGIYELKEGKVVNAWVQTDRLGFLQALEILPADLTQLSVKSKEHVRFIDKFIVPEKAKAEFMERVRISRAIIKDLPGFLEDAAYERTDEQGNLVFITVAVWENKSALEKAKAAVQAEYKKTGFDPAEMFERLNITMDRGVYREVSR